MQILHRLSCVTFVAALSSLACAQDAVEPERRPNVLVILLDDAGYHDFGFMGSTQMQTPNIDALAASGMTFSDAHLSGTTCSPSRAGIMTGRYQQRFGHHNNVPPRGKGMEPSERTIGDAFRAGGYRTFYVGKWHLGAVERYHPNRRGFDEFHGLLEGSRSYWPNAANDRPGGGKAIQHNGEPVEWQGYLTDHLTDAAVDYLRQPHERPFLMVLSYTAPHTPMHAREDHLEKFAGHPRQKLAAMLWAVDLGIGRVVEALVAEGLREQTMVFLFSDNGGPPGNTSDNGPLKGIKGTKFEGGQRTPFVLSWPARIPAGSSYGGLVSAMDVYPTAAAACGVDSTIGAPLDGVDVLPFVEGRRDGEPHEVLFWHRSAEHAVRRGDYKLIGHDEHGFRLFDVARDLGETRDLSAEHPELVREMRAELDAWEAELAQPQWHEAEQWNRVKSELYRAWLDDEQPRYTDPGGMRRAQRQPAGGR